MKKYITVNNILDNALAWVVVAFMVQFLLLLWSNYSIYVHDSNAVRTVTLVSFVLAVYLWFLKRRVVRGVKCQLCWTLVKLYFTLSLMLGFGTAMIMYQLSKLNVSGASVSLAFVGLLLPFVMVSRLQPEFD